MSVNVLIVDDSAVMRTLIKRVAVLSEAPIGVMYEASNGREALQILEKESIQAVFTDITMPVMNGTELLRAIARRDEWSHVVRVIISTDGSAARRAEVENLDVRLYLEKPFRPEAIRDVLSSLC
jgi:two-component system, chemotaxis family, chemotaxis protein CheY